MNTSYQNKMGCPWFGILFTLFLLFALPLRAYSVEPDRVPLLDRALAAIAMGRADLSMRPDLFETPTAFRRFNQWMRDLPNTPARAQTDASELLDKAADPEAWLRAMGGLGDMENAEPISPQAHVDYELPPDLPAPLEDAIEILLEGIHGANLGLAAVKNGTPPEKQTLMERTLFPKGCAPSSPSEETGMGDTPEKTIEALNAAEKVDRRAILQSALTLLRALNRAKAILSKPGAWKTTVRTFSIKTGLGMVTIGGTGSDRHRGDRALIIDLGGNDRYEGKIAAGVDGKCALVLDLDGDDLYLGDDGTQGVGIWGVGALVDLSGDDLYKAGNCSQGAGLFGVGLLMDGGGTDRYLGGDFVQAAASWGWGGLLDLEGEDLYQCRQLGQAYGAVSGISSLCDLAGNDKYLSGLNAPDPRETDMNQSFAQGFAMGIRNMAAGGIAILADRSGNDLYQCQYFGQGSSYWMGIGLLYDERGKDTYSARRYAQGAGIHFSLGLLLDTSGDDQTVSWGVSQGCGHDYGVGILINQEGNDAYTSSWLSMGASEANGIGLFIDNAGDDRYITRSGMAVGRLITMRRAGGIGLFMDAGGADRYAGGGGNDQLWSPNRWAVGVDSEERGECGLALSLPPSPAPLNRTIEEDATREEIQLADALVRSEDAPYPLNVQELLSVASHWGYDKDLSGVAREKLLSMEPGLSVPALVKSLDTPDIMSLIFLEEFFAIHAFHALPALVEALSDPAPLVQARALYFLGKLKDTRTVKDCIAALTHPSFKVRAGALRAIGDILDQERLDILVPMKQVFDEALETTKPVLLKPYLNEERLRQVLSVLVRAVPLNYRTYAAYTEDRSTLGRDKRDEAFTLLIFDHLEDINPILKRWVEDIKTSEKVSPQLSPFLQDPDPAVRAAAAYALGQLGYRPVIPVLLNLLGDSHLWVRDAATLALKKFGNHALSLLDSSMEKVSTASKILIMDILSGIKNERAKRILRTYLKNPDENLARAARQALEKQEAL